MHASVIPEGNDHRQSIANATDPHTEKRLWEGGTSRDRHFHVFLANTYCAGLCCHLAFLSHYFKPNTSLCSVIFSLQIRCTGVLCCYFGPKMFLPVTVYGTTHPHLVHMYWPLSWALHQMGHSFATFGTYILVVCWMNHIGTASTQKSPHLCSLCLHQWRVPQFALKCPYNPPLPPGRPSLGDHLSPPPPGRPSRATGGDCTGGGGTSGSTRGPSRW